MIEEKWDVLDAKGTPTGRTVLRGNFTLKPGEYHLVVHIWIISSKGQILIQRRSADKPLMPGEWAATGGAAIAGESSFDAAKRELFEELGIQCDETNLFKILRIKRKNSLLDVWFTVCDKPVRELQLQKSEVSSAKWVDMPHLEEMIQKGEFHNYGEEYFDRVLEKIEDYRGAYV